jgi:hypothetical protein
MFEDAKGGHKSKKEYNIERTKGQKGVTSSAPEG